MTYLPSLLALAGLHILAVASPGPAFIATVQLSSQNSRRVALLHALGLALAAIVWAAAAMLGLHELMLRFVWAYRILQFLGGCYLAYVGVLAWLHSSKGVAGIRPAVPKNMTPARALSRGFATNISNPKVVIFFASIFAAVLNPSWPFWVKITVLAMIACNEGRYYAALALLFSTARAQAAYQKAKVIIDRAAGSFMLLFGGKLIYSSVRGSFALESVEH